MTVSQQSDRGVAASRAALLWFVKTWPGRCVLLLVVIVLARIVLDALAPVASPVEVFASVAGVIGTVLLATRTRYAGFGWLAFLASNAGWLWFSHTHGFQFMFWQQVAFTITSLVGIFVWLMEETLQALDLSEADLL